MLSTRPEQSVGDDEIWTMATEALRAALETKVRIGALRSARRCLNSVPVAAMGIQS
jgi:hypothetical protein